MHFPTETMEIYSFMRNGPTWGILISGWEKGTTDIIYKKPELGFYFSPVEMYRVLWKS